jgi:hypothetical protein
VAHALRVEPPDNMPHGRPDPDPDPDPDPNGARSTTPGAAGEAGHG